MQILYDIIIPEINGHFGDVSNRVHLNANAFEIVHGNFECSSDRIEGLLLDSFRVFGYSNNFIMYSNLFSFRNMKYDTEICVSIALPRIGFQPHPQQRKTSSKLLFVIEVVVTATFMWQYTFSWKILSHPHVMIELVLSCIFLFFAKFQWFILRF